jgi:drug/metabolite transporter superfamily protein YnfA
MIKLDEHDGRKINWFRVFARTLGTSVAVIWAFMVIGGTIEEIITSTQPVKLVSESLTLLLLTVIAILGVIIAWRREKAGGIVTIIGAISIMIFAYYTSLSNKVRVMLVTGGPFIVAGILFLLSMGKSNKNKTL